VSGPPRGRLLFLSPVVPALAGNGLAMRAGMVLDALADTFDVSLLVVRAVAGAGDDLDAALARRCSRVATHRPVAVDPLFQLIERVKNPVDRRAAEIAYPRPALCRFATATAIGQAAAHFAGVSFDVVHVTRLYIAPFAGPFLDGAGAAPARLWLDLDDHECRTWIRLADAMAARGRGEAAELGRAEATKYAAMERQWIPRCDRVWVASPADVASVAREHPGAAVGALPNAVRLPDANPPVTSAGAPTFLFVGSLGYWPNEDAALFFCSEVLPRLRDLMRQPLRVHIAGTNPSRAVRALAADPDVALIDDVPDVARLYRAADVVVVPIRTGGGTRIKLLEAFAHRRPVVSTRAGAEGTAARDGEHLLIADSADEFAAACARLARDSALARALGDRARALVAEQHTLASVRDVLRRAWEAGRADGRDAPAAPSSAGPPPRA